jgi:hypothetical protein
MPTLASFRELFASHRAVATQGIAELVRRVVDGEQIPAAVLFEAAQNAGMNDDDVDAMAERMRTRDALRARASLREAAEAEAARLDAAISKHVEQLQESQRRFESAVVPLREQLQAAQYRVQDAAAAAADLFNPRHMEPRLAKRLQAAKDATHTTASAVSTLEREIHEQLKRAEEGERQLAAEGTTPARVEPIWRDDATRHTVGARVEKPFLNWLRGGIRAKEAKEKLPAARLAAKAAAEQLDAVELEVRTS